MKLTTLRQVIRAEQKVLSLYHSLAVAELESCTNYEDRDKIKFQMRSVAKEISCLVMDITEYYDGKRTPSLNQRESESEKVGEGNTEAVTKKTRKRSTNEST